jgi:hypothetical protein
MCSGMCLAHGVLLPRCAQEAPERNAGQGEQRTARGGRQEGALCPSVVVLALHHELCMDGLKLCLLRRPRLELEDLGLELLIHLLHRGRNTILGAPQDLRGHLSIYSNN